MKSLLFAFVAFLQVNSAHANVGAPNFVGMYEVVYDDPKLPQDIVAQDLVFSLRVYEDNTTTFKQVANWGTIECTGRLDLKDVDAGFIAHYINCGEFGKYDQVFLLQGVDITKQEFHARVFSSAVGSDYMMKFTRIEELAN